MRTFVVLTMDFFMIHGLICKNTRDIKNNKLNSNRLIKDKLAINIFNTLDDFTQQFENSTVI